MAVVRSEAGDDRLISHESVFSTDDYSSRGSEITQRVKWVSVRIQRTLSTRMALVCATNTARTAQGYRAQIAFLWWNGEQEGNGDLVNLSVSNTNVILMESCLVLSLIFHRDLIEERHRKWKQSPCLKMNQLKR
jgi:hypothetical protein